MNQIKSTKNRPKIPYLSNIQNKRFGGLIAIQDGREPYEFILKDLTAKGFADFQNEKVTITQKGRGELARLATLAGFMKVLEYNE